MLYKQDWEKAKARIEAFWNGEMLDRCAVAVVAPKNRERLERVNERLREGIIPCSAIFPH